VLRPAAPSTSRLNSETPSAGSTLPGAGYSYVRPCPLADERSAEIASGLVLRGEEIAWLAGGS